MIRERSVNRILSCSHYVDTLRNAVVGCSDDGRDPREARKAMRRLRLGTRGNGNNIGIFVAKNVFLIARLL